MSEPENPDQPRKKSGEPSEQKGGKEPEWAKGLRRLYDSVVDEPLPDSFEDLLKKLDKGNDG